MSNPYTLLPNLETEVEIPPKGILSRTIHNDDHVKLVLFAFAEGEELSAHTAPMAAALYLIKGNARLTLGEDTIEAKSGALVHMPPQLPHAIVALSPLVMLLSMYKQVRA